MDWGLNNRLSRIIQPDGHVLMLAVDHGYFLGPIKGLEQPKKTLEPLIPHADALMLTRGLLRNCIPPEANVPIVLRVSGATSIERDILPDEALTVSLEDAVRLNVSAITLSIFVGTEYERQTLEALSELVDFGEEYGIPVLAVTAVGREIGQKDARYLGLACRIAAEQGAHFVKTYYCDDFEKVTSSAMVPVVIAGGKKIETEIDIFDLAWHAINEGAIGCDFGRNIFQNEHPVAMIRALRSVVHENKKPKEALEMYNELAKVKAGS
jgi:3-hydroxy-5-phosphonooxypentane-2,4-dione thiolase